MFSRSLITWALMALAACPVLFAENRPVGGADEETQAAIRDFRRGALSDRLDTRIEAAELLVEVAGKDALEAMLWEYSRAFQERQKARSKHEKLGISLRAQRRVLADLKLRSQRDDSLTDIVREHEDNLKDSEASLKDGSRVRELTESWGLALAAAIEAEAGRQRASTRKQLERGLWRDLEKGDKAMRRSAAADLLGRIGMEGTVLRLQKAISRLESERLRAHKKLPRAEAEVRKFELLLQKATAAGGGRVSQALTQQYDRIRAEAASLRAQAKGASDVAHECALAAVEAFGRLSDEQGPKTLAGLELAANKGRGVVRQLTLGILATCGDESTRERLHERLASEDDPADQARLIDDLCLAGDFGIEPLLLGRYIHSENWHVAARAIAGLATLRSKPAIPVLIEELEQARGRRAIDISRALRSLTGQKISSLAVWRRWWQSEGETFVLPEASVVRAEVEAEREAVGGTSSVYFGVEIRAAESVERGIVFVVDLSGSMNYSMVSRSNVGEERPNPPRGEELSRLEFVKNELARAVSALADETSFNLVLYASSAWTWKKDMVRMDANRRAEVLEFIDGLSAVGGTNIYGAMAEVFRLAGLDPSGSWSDTKVDTVFLLSDGHPSVGTSSDPETILSYVSETNRGSGVIIHTIGLSGSQDAYLMRSMAETNGGTYTAR